MATTRTSSPYFSPNSARAPDAIASSTAISRVTTGAFSSTRSLARSSTRAISLSAIGFGRDERALLRHVIAEHLAQRLVQQMRGGMIAADVAAPRVVDFERKRHVRLERARLDRAGMHEHVAGILLRVGDAETHALAGHDPDVADLPAGLAVERRLVEHDGAALAFIQLGDFRAVLDQRLDHAFRALGLVAEELGRADLLAQRKPHHLGRRVARARP